MIRVMAAFKWLSDCCGCVAYLWVGREPHTHTHTHTHCCVCQMLLGVQLKPAVQFSFADNSGTWSERRRSCVISKSCPVQTNLFDKHWQQRARRRRSRSLLLLLWPFGVILSWPSLSFFILFFVLFLVEWKRTTFSIVLIGHTYLHIRAAAAAAAGANQLRRHRKPRPFAVSVCCLRALETVVQ